MPKSQFAGPGESYPIPDANHARLAKSGASRAANVGNISEAQKESIDDKADRKLGIKEGSPRDRKIDRSKGITEDDNKPSAPSRSVGKIMAAGSHAQRHGR